MRFQGPVQLKICDVPKFVPARGTYPEVQELTNGNESVKTKYANAHAQEGFNMEFTDLEVPIPRLAQNLSTQAETKTIALVYNWKTVVNGVRILAVEINRTEKKKGEKFKVIGCRRPGRSRPITLVLSPSRKEPAHNFSYGPAPSWTATESSNSVPNTKENLITSHNQP